MADNFLNLPGLTRFKQKLDDLFGTKQDTLVSGTNIKTINNNSILGSGDLEIGPKVFALSSGAQGSTYAEVREAVDYWSSNKANTFVYVNGALVNDIEDSNSMLKFQIGPYYDPDWGLGQLFVIVCNYTDTTNLGWVRLSKYVQERLNNATDTVAGIVKLNPNQNITLNSDGQLEVGGRIGQFEGTTGLFAPNNREPRNVLDYAFLITDAMGMDMSANRAFALVTGLGVNCRSAAAGSTQYRIQNTYTNRILAKLCENGYAARDEATSKAEKIVPVVSVQIGGANYTPDSSANPSGTANDIIITTAETLNPDSAITNIRLFGKMQSYATAHIGNGIASWGGGRNFLLGGGVIKDGSSNDDCLVGNGIYCSGNGNAAFGRYHIVRKNRGFFAGQGHDSTNASSEGVSAMGSYSYIDVNTLFAIGNGSSHTARLNAFEVLKDGGIVLRSPNGTRYRIAVDDRGNISTSAIT